MTTRHTAETVLASFTQESPQTDPDTGIIRSRGVTVFDFGGLAAAHAAALNQIALMQEGADQQIAAAAQRRQEIAQLGENIRADRAELSRLRPIVEAAREWVEELSHVATDMGEWIDPAKQRIIDAVRAADATPLKVVMMDMGGAVTDEECRAIPFPPDYVHRTGGERIDAAICPRCGKVTQRDDVHTCSPQVRADKGERE